MPNPEMPGSNVGELLQPISFFFFFSRKRKIYASSRWQRIGLVRRLPSAYGHMLICALSVTNDLERMSFSATNDCLARGRLPPCFCSSSALYTSRYPIIFFSVALFHINTFYFASSSLLLEQRFIRLKNIACLLAGPFILALHLLRLTNSQHPVVEIPG